MYRVLQEESARQQNAPAAFTRGEIPGTHFQRLSRPHGTWFRREPLKKSPVAPLGIDPGTSRIAAQCLNHYATPGTTEERNYKKQIKEEDNHIYRCFQGGIVIKEVCGKIRERSQKGKKEDLFS